VLGPALLLVGLPAGSGEVSIKETLRFAAEMAERGNWREAQYRWEAVAARAPDNPVVFNNLAVAAEATGDPDEALEYYEKALALSESDPRILDNQRRAVRVSRELKERAGETNGPDSSSAAPAAGDSEPPGKSKGGKPVRVQIGIPIPARLDLEGMETALVASFLTEQTVLLDVNRELVRFLRTELRKHTELEILDVVPPPAIPEQRADELVLNHEFWRYLAREHGADLIVSGVVDYSRFDVSGFQEVDVVSPQTGQKVRQTRFVEQEEFAYVLDVFFIDGATGTLLHRDRLRRNVVFRGMMNDPIHAFYGLSESIGADIMSAVSTRIRTETRTIFRR
jgi:hypothetical protein